MEFEWISCVLNLEEEITSQNLSSKVLLQLLDVFNYRYANKENAIFYFIKENFADYDIQNNWHEDDNAVKCVSLLFLIYLVFKHDDESLRNRISSKLPVSSQTFIRDFLENVLQSNPLINEDIILNAVEASRKSKLIARKSVTVSSPASSSSLDSTPLTRKRRNSLLHDFYQSPNTQRHQLKERQKELETKLKEAIEKHSEASSEYTAEIESLKLKLEDATNNYENADVPNKEAELLRIYVKDLEEIGENPELSELTRRDALVRGAIEKIKEAKLESEYKELIEKAVHASSTARMVMKMVDKLMTTMSASPIKTSGRTRMNITWTPTLFAGEPSKWMTWWALFDNTVHSNPDLDAQQKVNMLEQCLEGEAREHLADLDFIAANYDTAIKTLRKRFSDPVVLCQTYYSDMEKIKPAVTIREQRHALDRVKAIVRNLELVKEIPMENQRVVSIIGRKFPRNLLRSALRVLSQSKPDLIYGPGDLITAIESDIKLEEHIESTFFFSEKRETTLVSVTTGHKRPNFDSQNKNNSCIFCKYEHASSKCKKYPTVASRKAQLNNMKKCFNCMKFGHELTRCRNPPRRCDNCGGPQHPCLCVVGSSAGGKPAKRSKLCDIVFLQTFSCTVIGIKANSEIGARGLFDIGSTRSYINNNLVKNLGYSLGKQHSVQCMRFTEDSPSFLISNEVEVTFRNNTYQKCTLRMFTTNCKVGGIQTAPPVQKVNEVLPPNLNYADYDIFENNQRSIQILIGADLYHTLVQVQTTQILSSGIHIIKSFFGWVPSGGTHSYEQKLQSKNVCGLLSAKVETNKNIYTEPCNHTFDISNLEPLWSLDTLGIEDPSRHDNITEVITHFHQTTFVQEDGRMNVRFPWKNSKVRLSSNRRVALARLRSLIEKTPFAELQNVHEHFRTQLREGIIEKVPHENFRIRGNDVRIHYLPHRWLLQKQKIRVVYDASAKTKGGMSLNDLIHTGPNLTENLVRLLLNFRLHAIGLIADIEKAFLQIVLNEIDRDAVRFLWVKDPHKPTTSENIEYLRLTRVPFGVNASPFLLNIVLQETLIRPPDNKWLLLSKRNFYVDNFVTSVTSPMDALNIYEALTNRLKSINMNLREWMTNDRAVALALGDQNNIARPETVSVLGLNWNTIKDTLAIKIGDKVTKQSTKRNLLKMLASVYDPLGLIAPALLPLKLMIQNCWKTSYGWDLALPSNISASWLKLYNELLPIKNIIIPRLCCPKTEPSHYFLHIFCDASKDAFGCCAYLVSYNNQTMEKSSHLIFAKTRITPMKHSRTLPKPLTIPKLELLALLAGKRSAQFLHSTLSINITQKILWTDATTVLQWLQSTEVLAPFIGNRIKEIQQASDLLIKFVPSLDNPADIVSRGMSAAALKTNRLWWHGPTWLLQKKLWPSPPLNVQEYNSELATIQVTILLAADIKEEEKESEIVTANIENNRSSWRSQIRIMRYILTFVTRCKKEILSSSELWYRAEHLLIVEVQKKYYGKTYSMLQKGKKVPNNLDLFLDKEGLIRCKGRLHYAQFPWEITHPIFMPRKSNVTFNYIKHVHINNMHIGASHTLAKLREKMWVIKARAKVQSVIRRCFFCKYWEGGSYQLPPIPPLPEIRLRSITCFLQIGLDYFGPLQIKDAYGHPLDAYILIFTCLVSRGVHLELVPDMSGEHFLMALQRMCDLKHVPKIIISDNAKTFKFVQPLVGKKVHISDHKINDFLDSNYIEWYFIPKYAPWYGGAYERLIGLIKRSLRKSYGHKLLNYIEFQTVLYTMADIINGRPLTYIPSKEPIETLTPNHLIKLGPTNINISLEPHKPRILTNTGSNLIKKWEFRNRVLNAYWEAFRRLYLISLRERHTVSHPTKKGSVSFLPNVGDVVLVEQPGVPRGQWKIGRIEKLDKRQAVAHVRCNNFTIIRSIRQLYPLVQAQESESDTDKPPLPAA